MMLKVAIGGTSCFVIKMSFVWRTGSARSDLFNMSQVLSEKTFKGILNLECATASATFPCFPIWAKSMFNRNFFPLPPAS